MVNLTNTFAVKSIAFLNISTVSCSPYLIRSDASACQNQSMLLSQPDEQLLTLCKLGGNDGTSLLARTILLLDRNFVNDASSPLPLA